MKTEHTDVSAWLRRWGAQSGGGLLEINAQGTCSFTVQQMPMQLTLDIPHQQMLLAAMALDEDASGQPAVMRAMLEFAHLGERSRHCGVSLAQTGRPVIWLWHGIALLDETGFDNTMNNFVASAQQSREALQAARQPAAHGSYITDMPRGMIRA